ncbi:MAG: ATP-dependent helicase [Microbacteriaceae bacterium]|nr:ATP-dependent helicase [Microbacteriaceae bacterium]
MATIADQLLAKLDTQQRAIAAHLHGPVAVLAGAGTGKTRTITHRIAYGVHTGEYAPENVLSISYTRRAAGELQARLGQLGVSGVAARTIHSAALEQCNSFWESAVGGRRPEIYSAKLPILEQIFEERGSSAAPGMLAEVASEIEWRKVSVLSLETYADLLPQRDLPPGVSGDLMLQLMQDYEEFKIRRGILDLEDMLAFVSGMIESDESVARAVRERYRFLTVDEYQDVSPLQHSLIRTWLGDNENLCVVGDASQTIYSFSGAQQRFLLDFMREFPAATQYRLEQNYRSTPEIVRVANTLMRDQPGALQLRAAKKHGEEVAAAWFPTVKREYQAVADDISAALQNGENPAQIAVLARTRAQLHEISQYLHTRSIATQQHRGDEMRFFNRAEIRQAVLQLKAFADTGINRPIFQVVSDVLRNCGWTPQEPANMADREKWLGFQALLQLVDETGAENVQQLAEQLLQLSLAQYEPEIAAVTLIPVHSAKGLEWDRVYVVGMTEGLLPVAQAISADLVDEERRLAYVAFTRARHVLRLSGSAEGRREPSRFLREAQVRTIQVS